MKTTIRIGRLELTTLFCSPIAWLLLVIFSVQVGLDFISGFTNALMYQGEGNINSMLTQVVYANKSAGMFLDVEKNLYLYVPLLTMGLMSREFSSGSIKLLLSSPVRLRQIVAGKFLAIMVYWSILLLLLSLFVLAGTLTVDGLDVKLILSGMLGIFLLACAYSAVGLLMSSFTSYQVVAAISTLVVLAALNFIGGLWQEIPFLRDISWFLHTQEHSDNLLMGLIVSKDVWYFIIIMGLFLELSILYLRSRTESRSFWVMASRYLLFTCIMLMVGYVLSLPVLTGYYDVTRDQENTVAPVTRETLKQIKGPVRITAYQNLFSPLHLGGIAEPRNRNYVLQAWSGYTRFLPDLYFKYVLFYDTVENSMMNRLYPGPLDEAVKKLALFDKLDIHTILTPSEIHKVIDLKQENNLSSYLLEYGNRRVLLRDGPSNPLADDPAGEVCVTTAFKRMLVRVPKVAFLTGHNERSAFEGGGGNYSDFSTDPGKSVSLINTGFDVIPLSLDSSVPGDIDVLVVADPLKPFTEAERQKLKEYIEEGGNLLIAGEPGKQAIVNPLLKMLGIRFMDGMLVQQTRDYAPDMIFAGFTPSAVKVSGQYGVFVEKDQRVFMQGAAGIQIDSIGRFAVTPLLVTDEKDAWNKTAPFKLDTGRLSFNPSSGDRQGPIPVAVALTRQTDGREQRIVVLGDADFIDNDKVYDSPENAVNAVFLTGIYRWFAHGEFPLDISRPLVYNKIRISHRQARTMRLLLLGALPCMLTLFGAGFLWKRRRM